MAPKNKTSKKTKKDFDQIKRIKNGPFFKWALILLVGSLIGGTATYLYLNNQTSPLPQQQEEKNVYTGFLLEVYDKIQENYWKKLSEAELAGLFKQGSEQLIRAQYRVEPNNKQGLQQMFNKALSQLNQEQKKEYAVKLANLVLSSLEPAGRNALYTQKQETDLKNLVENVNPETGEIEPTVFSKLITPDISYIWISKMSPQTLEEFQKTTENISENQDPNALILDLRNNIGGAIDILPYFLGHFIGQGQYAYEFYHQGEYTPYKTKTGWLPGLIKYKKVVILINENAQSSAELMAAVLKKYNVGVVLGTTTRGWGTIERVFPLENQISDNETYSIFLVHTLTLRDDNQPIEGNGVNPLIAINDTNWKKQLLQYFNYPELIEEIEQIWNQNPKEFSQ